MTFKEKEEKLRARIARLEQECSEKAKYGAEYRLKYSTANRELEETREFRRKYYDMKHERDELFKQNEKLKRSLELERNGRGSGRKPYSNKEAVQLAFTSYYMLKSSLQNIADMLNGNGIKTSRGSQWSKSAVKYVLNNKKYIDMEYVEEEVFNNVQNMLNQNRKY
jgi:predicted RNase H-like nuclease (RuvC/YqgF family)